MHSISYEINTWKVQNCITEFQESGCRNLDSFQNLLFLFFPALLHYIQRDRKMGSSPGVSQSPYLEAPCLYENPYTLMKVAFASPMLYRELEKAQSVLSNV